MKRRFLFLMLVFVFASSVQSLHAQKARVPVDPRANYDPLYAAHPGPHHHKSFMQTLRENLNPSDTNYGIVVRGYVDTAILATIKQTYFWLVLLLTGFLGFETLYVYYLLRDRRRRLWISSEIVAQLYNAFFHSYNKTLEAIAAHNNLVKEINRDFTAKQSTVEMQPPALAISPDIYRQPEAVAMQRLSGSDSTVVHDMTDGFSEALAANSPGKDAEQSAVPPTQFVERSPISQPASDEKPAKDSREPQSLEQAQRQISALQRKLQNTRAALNQRDDTIRSLQDNQDPLNE